MAAGPSALTILALTLAYLVLLLLPGAAALCLIARRQRVGQLACVTLLIGVTPTLGYAAFWIFLADKTSGRLFCYAVYLGSLSLLATAGRTRSFWKTLGRAGWQPIALAVAAALLYLSLFWLYGDAGRGAALANDRFFDNGTPGDNLIPLIFADRIYSRMPFHPLCCGDWLSSDRPPLQTGVILLLRPIRLVAAGNIDYQVVATLLQCFAFAAAWTLLRVSGLSKGVASQTVVLLIFSGFFFYNAVYVWPKMLAAAFVLIGLAWLVHAIRRKKALTKTDALLSGCSIGLALLAHPGSVFSLPAFAIAAFRNRKLIGLRPLAFALLPCAALLISWSAYQRWIDPPGNRLTKMHLAGVFEIDGRGLLQALRDSYGDLSAAEIARYKLANFAMLFGTDPILSTSFARTGQARNTQRQYIWSSLGLLELGWAAVFLWASRQRKNRHKLHPIAWLLIGASFNFIIWSLVLFGPGRTFTTHSSFADILLLGLSLATFALALLPRWCAWLLAGWGIYNLYGTWALSPAKQLASASLHGSFLTSAICITAALVWFVLLKPSCSPSRVMNLQMAPAPLPVP